jgi:hypothetical protein
MIPKVRAREALERLSKNLKLTVNKHDQIAWLLTDGSLEEIHSFVNALADKEALDCYDIHGWDKGLHEGDSMSENLENLSPEAQESLDGSPATVEILSEDGKETYGWLRFQCGPIKEHGKNGTTIEEVIQKLIERLEGFQNGPFKCEENDKALAHLDGAKESLEDRTRRRIADGTEGTNEGQ